MFLQVGVKWMHGWVNLKTCWEDKKTEVNKCIKQQPNFSPWSRHKINEAIKKMTKSFQGFLQDVGLVGVVS